LRGWYGSSYSDAFDVHVHDLLYLHRIVRIFNHVVGNAAQNNLIRTRRSYLGLAGALPRSPVFRRIENPLLNSIVAAKSRSGEFAAADVRQARARSYNSAQKIPLVLVI